jgi:hypothetical protein
LFPEDAPCGIRAPDRFACLRGAISASGRVEPDPSSRSDEEEMQKRAVSMNQFQNQACLHAEAKRISLRARILVNAG